MKRLSKLKEEQPEALSNPQIFDLAEQADQLQELKAVYDTEGGKQLVKLLTESAVAEVNRLCAGYRTMTRDEMVTSITTMDAHLSTARLLINAKEGVAIIDAELKEALRE